MPAAVIIPPQQMLSDMDKALEIEIKSKEKGGKSKSHNAVDGQPRGEQNGFYLYQYTLDEPWTPEDDTPIEVQVQSKTPINATIVSATGTVITIATKEPLPPEALEKITLLDDSVKITKRLREALQNNRESDAKLGLKTFGHEKSFSDVAASSIPSTVFDPNDSQGRAINLAIGSEVTYIIGPPGTGKTVTLAAIALEFFKSERTVLIASHTNIAVDNAIKQLADLCRKAGMDEKLHAGKVLRYGATQLPELKKTEYDDISTSAIAKRRSVHLYEQKEQLETSLKEFEGYLQKLASAEQKLQSDWESKRQQALTQISAYEAEMSRLQTIEEQRKTDLTNQKTAYEKSYWQFRQRLSAIEQQLATANSDYVRWETTYKQYKEQQASFTAQLAAAQQMSKVTRLFKGIRLDKLEKGVSDVNFQIWRIEERLRELWQYLHQGYEERAACESQLEQKLHNLQEIDSQINTPTKEAASIANLHATISPWKQYLAEGDQQWKATQQNFQQQERELNENIMAIRERSSELDRELQELEKRILAEAQVVATTLSKIFMSAALNDRSFDVVIIDEISAAPMPAVYIAALRANQSVIAIGDPQQLAPICTAQSDRQLHENERHLAKMWLGTDLFSHLQITLESVVGGQRNCTMLTHQSRMHPQISTLTREYVYNGCLLDEVRRVPKEEYAHIEPGRGQHLLLCDTSDAFPIAVQSAFGSRFNVYHALCAIAIARQALLSLGNDTYQEGKELIGIVTPYKKQAKLLQRLIEDAGMKQFVRAGTVHKFQGLEFDVVIFDTVESPPIDPPKEFIVIGQEAVRLLNVAITRAKHKLIVVANAQHIDTARDRNGGFAFPEDSILRKVIAAAKLKGNITSLDIVRLPLLNESGQDSDLYHEKLSQLPYKPESLEYEHLSEHTFYDRLFQDISVAQKQIIVYSPFLSRERARNVKPLLLERCRAGVDVIVATSNIKGFAFYEPIITALKQGGVRHQQLAGEHQKFAFIDNTIAYIGSLNALSQVGTAEYMLRIKSPKFVESIWKFIGIERVVKAPINLGSPIPILYSKLPNNLTCKKCGRALILTKGKFGAFYGCEDYWKTGCDYTEDISEEHLRGIAQLSGTRCDKCKGPTKLSVYRKNAWLICSAPVPCDFGYSIEYLDDRSGSRKR